MFDGSELGALLGFVDGVLDGSELGAFDGAFGSIRAVTVDVRIADAEASALTTAFDSVETAGAFANIALAMPPDVTASVNCATMELARVLTSVPVELNAMSKEILVTSVPGEAPVSEPEPDGAVPPPS